jgi:hypothetical protein
MILEGIYRRFSALRVAKGPIDMRMTFTEAVAIAQVEPEGHEMTRAGRRFSIGWTGAVPTGIAPVQAFPTTAAQWVLWNGDLSKTYSLTALGALLFSGTKGLGGTLLAALFSTPSQQDLAQQAGASVVSHSLSAIGSKAVVKSGITLTGPAVPLWTPVAEDLIAVASVGPVMAMVNRIKAGRLQIPPQKGLALAVLAPAGTTPLYLPLAEWIEVETDME